MAKDKKPREVAFSVPASDTGDTFEGEYDLYGKKVATRIYHKNLSYRPPKHDWEGALIHLAAKALDGQLRLGSDPAENQRKIKEVLADWLYDRNSIETGPSTVRDKAKEIMAELNRVRVRDE
jgi:hypothetical protein